MVQYTVFYFRFWEERWILYWFYNDEWFFFICIHYHLLGWNVSIFFNRFSGRKVNLVSTLEVISKKFRWQKNMMQWNVIRKIEIFKQTQFLKKKKSILFFSVFLKKNPYIHEILTECLNFYARTIQFLKYWSKNMKM